MLRSYPLARRTSGLSIALSLGLLAGCGSDDDAPGESLIGGGGRSADGGGIDGGLNGAGLFGSGGAFSPGRGGGPSTVGDGGDDTCASTDVQAIEVPTQVLFLVDRSGSMNCNPPEGDAALAAACVQNPQKTDAAAPSKWEITRDALTSALAALGNQTNVSAGLAVFPRRDGQLKCQVPSEPDVAIGALNQSQRDAFDAHLRSAEADPPLGDTPIAGTMLLAYEHLRQRLVSGAFSGNSFVILLTDGEETCAGDEFTRLVSGDVSLATQFDIRTFVIGAPGSEGARATLSQIAFDGLTPGTTDCSHGDSDTTVGDCHFDMTTSTDFAGELQRALAQISQQTSLTCEFDVPQSPDGRPVDLGKVNVTYTPSSADAEEVSQVDCDAGESGWSYDDSFSKILLCGDLCDRVQDDPQGDVVIELGCETRTIDIR